MKHALLFGFFIFSLSTPSFSQSMKMGDPLPANAFVELAKLINPTVVNISTSTMPRGRGLQRDPFLDMLERFYGVPITPPQARPQQALGTGFIIRDDGLIVTNNHVIAGADKINVQLDEDSDKFYEATLIGSDERTDIALIKISRKEKFKFAKLGSSKDVQVGEWVAAFGNPFGNGHTMTKGIISAKGRDISELNRFPLLQTDTPINPGNSGGPLVNLKGEVIGVNSAIDARAQGIGFAIPIDEVKNIIPQLEKYGSVSTGYMGVGLDDLNPRSAAYLGLKDLSGALIVHVEKGSAADKAGIRPYDVVTEFNGKKVTNSFDLRNAVADTDSGKNVKVQVIREGKTKTLNIKLGERPKQARVRSTPKKQYIGQKAPYELGFTVSDANETLTEDFSIPEEYQSKPVIIDVSPGTPAAFIGLQPGDIIIDVNRKNVRGAKEVLQSLKKGSNTLRVARPGMGVRIIVIDSQ